MSSLDRSAAIPPSPTSPTRLGLKRRRSSEHLPNSPVSPPFMSVATKSYVSAYPNNQHTDENSTRSSPGSPRASVSRAHQSDARPTHSLPTPAHSVIGGSATEGMEDSDAHRDKRPRLDMDRTDDAVEMDVEQSITPTNHDRQGHPQNNKSAATALESGRTNNRPGSRSSRGETTLDQVDEDMGEAFLLCRSKVEQQRPDPRDHLLALYDCLPLLRSVARIDPNTGEKINKLRSSYAGQIKQFQLAGRHKPVKCNRNVEAGEPGPLRQMAGSYIGGMIADDQWNGEHAKSKIGGTLDFMSKLTEAMSLRPGPVKNNAQWEDILGLDNKPKIAPIPPQAVNQKIPPHLPNGAIRPMSNQNAEIKRQTRGKKRSYGDDSFVGYGEGYSDGEEMGDADDFGGQRKRKKESISNPATYEAFRR